MEIREVREGDVVVLSPDGNLAGGEETSARESKLAAVQQGGARQLVIDCTSVGQLTSVAVRALLHASGKLGRAQGRLVLYGTNAKVRKAFAISGFDKDFAIVATREEALAAVLQPSAAPRGQRRTAPTATPVADQAPPAGEVPVREPEAPPRPEDSAVPVASARREAVAGTTDSAAGVAAPAPARTLAAAAKDPRAALANAVLDALGVRMLPAPATGSGSVAPRALEAAADAVLAALGAGRG